MSYAEIIKAGSRVLLLNPPIADTIEAEQMDMITCVEPFGLLRLGSYFRQKGCDVQLLDCLRDPMLHGQSRRHIRKVLPCGSAEEGRTKEIHHFGLDRQQLAQRLGTLDEPDLIAVTSIFSWQLEAVLESLEVCKEVYEGAHLVVGGNMPTLCPEQFSGCAADEIVGGDLPGASFLPTALDLMPAGVRSDHLRMIKGCPYECSYCVTNCLNDGQVIARPPEEVFAEMQEKVALHQTRVFTFFDDFVLFKQKRYLDVFLDLVIQEKPPVILQFPLGFSAHMITEEFARRMRDAGVETMILALETISEQRSREMQRPDNMEEFTRAVDLLKAFGYRGRNLRVFYLMGLPGQTLDEILRAILFLLSLGISPSLTTYALAPRSRDWQRYHSRVPHTGLDDFTPGLWRFAHEGMSSSALDHVYRYFHERYYPLSRIAQSATDDPIILAMQKILRGQKHLPQNW